MGLPGLGAEGNRSWKKKLVASIEDSENVTGDSDWLLLE